MLQYYVIAIAIIISPTISAPFMQNGEYEVPDDDAQCTNDLIDWCKGMQFPDQSAGLSVVSITVDCYRYFCESDSDGTNCTRNGSPWLACSSDNVLSYKGKPLMKNSTDGTDDEICQAAKTAFNDLNALNIRSLDNKTEEAVRHALKKGSAILQRQGKDLRHNLQQKGEDLRHNLQQKGEDLRHNLQQKGEELRDSLQGHLEDLQDTLSNALGR